MKTMEWNIYSRVQSRWSICLCIKTNYFIAENKITKNKLKDNLKDVTNCHKNLHNDLIIIRIWKFILSDSLFIDCLYLFVYLTAILLYSFIEITSLRIYILYLFPKWKAKCCHKSYLPLEKWIDWIVFKSLSNWYIFFFLFNCLIIKLIGQ